jgi:hypothetical protein
VSALTTAIGHWRPIYDYHRPLIGHWPRVLADVLARAEELERLPIRWDTVALDNAAMPDWARAIMRGAGERRRARQHVGWEYRSRIDRIITLRQPGEYLARQEQIDYALLAAAHERPGWSMHDNLLRVGTTSARRLAGGAR